MKNSIIILVSLIYFSNCKNSNVVEKNNYFNLKNSIIYADNKNNIFLKREIYIVSRKKIDKKKTAYFDLAIYKDSVVKLKDFINLNSFYQIKKDSFIDKKYVYIFDNFPNAFPKIKIYNLSNNNTKCN